MDTKRTQGENVEIFQLVVDSGSLPQKLEELTPLSFIGQAAVDFYRAKVRMMDQLGMTEDQRKATLRDGQDAGKMLLQIEARIGEILPSVEETRRTGAGGHGVGHRTLPDEFGDNDRQRRHKARTARTIAAASKDGTLDAVIREAEENEDIPTKTAVINRIRLSQERARREAADKQEKPELIMTLEQMQYINTLERLIHLLPKQPPRDWSEKGFERAQALARIITKRLEVFNAEDRNHITE